MRTDKTTHTTYTLALAADVTRFVWDNQDVLLETNAGGVTQTAYTQTPALFGEIVAQRKSGASRFYHFDGLGSTMELTDGAEATTDTLRYRAFGESLVATGSTAPRYRWVGKLGYYWQSDNGIALDYVRARWYRPRIGRWVSEDPLGLLGSAYVAPRRTGQVGARTTTGAGAVSILDWAGDLPGYTYAGQGPVGPVDPTGLSAFGDCIAAIKCAASYHGCLADMYRNESQCVHDCLGFWDFLTTYPGEAIANLVLGCLGVLVPPLTPVALAYCLGTAAAYLGALIPCWVVCAQGAHLEEDNCRTSYHFCLRRASH